MAVFLVGLGILLLILGGALGFLGVSEMGEHSRLQEMLPLDPGVPARVGYLEGHLSEDNPVLQHGFVFYFRSEFRGYRGQEEDRRPLWKTVERKLPPLLVESLTSGQGRVRITRDYRVTFLGSDPTWVTPGEAEVGKTERFEGLPAGHPVVIVGRPVLEESRELPLVEAEILGSGTLEDLRSGAEAGSRFGLIACAVFLVAGGVLLTIGLRQLL